MICKWRRESARQIVAGVARRWSCSVVWGCSSFWRSCWRPGATQHAAVAVEEKRCNLESVKEVEENLWQREAKWREVNIWIWIFRIASSKLRMLWHLDLRCFEINPEVELILRSTSKESHAMSVGSPRKLRSKFPPKNFEVWIIEVLQKCSWDTWISVSVTKPLGSSLCRCPFFFSDVFFGRF